MKELDMNETQAVAAGNVADALVGLFIFAGPLVIGVVLGYYGYFNYVRPLNRIDVLCAR